MTASRIRHPGEFRWETRLLAVVTATLVTVLLTHRVAGPLYRFRRVFADVGRGVLTMRVTLRHGDYLTAEAADLDRMVSALRERVAAAKTALTQAHDALAR